MTQPGAVKLSPAAQQMLEIAALGRTRPAIHQALAMLADGLSLEHLIDDVLAPAQRQVGVLWQTNQWSVAQEHAATAVIDGVLGAVAMQTASPASWRGTVLAACVEEEYHTVPARMGVEILRLHGWDVTFLGASVPAQDVLSFAEQTAPDVILLSCTVALFLPGAARCIAALSELGIPVVVAGAAFGETAVRAELLGASGWIGGGLDASEVLDRVIRTTEVPTGPSHSADIESTQLEIQSEELTAACMARMLLGIPAMSEYTNRQLARSKADVAYILRYLGVTLDLDEPALFDGFISWLSNVLASRGLPPTVLIVSLELIANTVRQAGLARTADLCSSSRDRLIENASQAR